MARLASLADVRTLLELGKLDREELETLALHLVNKAERLARANRKARRLAQLGAQAEDAGARAWARVERVPKGARKRIRGAGFTLAGDAAMLAGELGLDRVELASLLCTLLLADDDDDNDDQAEPEPEPRKGATA